MLSPIISQPMGSAEKNTWRSTHGETKETSDTLDFINDTLDFAAGASSLRSDIAMCEKIMTDKHEFLVSMLDGMGKKMQKMTDSMDNLEKRVHKLEATQEQTLNDAQAIFQTANSRQNDLETQMNHGTKRMNDAIHEWQTIDQRIRNIETYLKGQTTTQCSHTCTDNDSKESRSIAIYGLPEYGEVRNTVNKLFHDMYLQNVRCKTAHRTPNRQNKVGVVIAEMESLQDKQEILKRKRYVRSYPQYANVYIKTSKTHTEQVMDANFHAVLNEIPNGSSYYVSDNGRILSKQNNSQQTYDNHEQHRHQYRSDDVRNHSSNYGGARPTSAQNNSQSAIQEQHRSNGESSINNNRYSAQQEI